MIDYAQVSRMVNSDGYAGTFKPLSIAVPRVRFIFYPDRNPITLALEKAGHLVFPEPISLTDCRRCDVVLILGGMKRVLPLLREITKRPRRDRPLVVAWHFDPLPPPRSAGLRWPLLTPNELARIILPKKRPFDAYTNYFLLRKLVRRGWTDLLAVSTQGRADFLTERGISASWVPLGYSSDLGHDMGIARDIDVMFLGDLYVPRRRRILRRLRRKGVDVQVRGDLFDPSWYGEDRTRFLNRTKIFLNFPRFTGEFAGLRMLLAAANKTLMVSEPMYNPAPFVAGKHFVSAEVKDMPDVIAYYLAHEDERERIAGEAHRLATQEVTMDRSVSLLVKLITENLHPNR